MILKLVVFVPTDAEERVRKALADAGCGKFDKYDNCFFKTKGIGHFRPLENSNPTIGKRGVIESVEEYKIETVVEESLLPAVLAALKEAHPYEEIAYDVLQTHNDKHKVPE